ncbi:hypothetical protein [Paenibacillus pini]|nr:hypothetical protein [Paenibacillus pini]
MGNLPVYNLADFANTSIRFVAFPYQLDKAGLTRQLIGLSNREFVL